MNLRIDLGIITDLLWGFKCFYAGKPGKMKNLQIIWNGGVKNMGDRGPPCPSRFSRVHPNMTCTKWQVGCRSVAYLLPASTYRQSVGGRSARHHRSLTSRLKDVGPNGHNTHQAGICSIHYNYMRLMGK